MLDLKNFVPDGRVSTGILGTYEGRLVWAVARQAYWRKTPLGTVIGIIGIGGGQEHGESLIDAVTREAMEETCSRVGVTGAKRTVWAYGDGTAKVVDLSRARDGACARSRDCAGEPAPALIWQAPLNYLDSKGNWRVIDYICAVYQGEFLDRPRPASEVTGLIFCTTDDFLAMLRDPVPMKQFLSHGGMYTGEQLPEDTCFELHGSALYLARHWVLLQLSAQQFAITCRS